MSSLDTTATTTIGTSDPSMTSFHSRAQDNAQLPQDSQIATTSPSSAIEYNTACRSSASSLWAARHTERSEKPSGTAETQESSDLEPSSDETDDDVGEESDEADAFATRDADTLRLPNGKTIAHRSRPPRPRTRRTRREEDDSDSVPTVRPPIPSAPRGADAADPDTRASVERALFGTALPAHSPHIRVSDRATLAHLPTAQQRALLATGNAQAGAALRAEQHAATGLALKGNKTHMRFFLPRVPKRRNGLHRSSLRA